MTLNNPSFSKSQRFQVMDFKANNNPGPGAYQETLDFGYNSQEGVRRGYTMRPKTNMWTKQVPVPGPGNYEHRQLIGTKYSGPAKTMSAILNTSHFSVAGRTPGPGRYLEEQQGTLTRRAPSYSMRPKTEHIKAGFRDTPGPGAYDSNTSFNSSSSLDRGLRKSMSKKYILGNVEPPKPGPGQYSPVRLGATAAPKYTMRPKTNAIKQGSRALDNSPGPGAYATQEFIGKVRPRNRM